MILATSSVVMLIAHVRLMGFGAEVTLFATVSYGYNLLDIPLRLTSTSANAIDRHNL